MDDYWDDEEDINDYGVEEEDSNEKGSKDSIINDATSRALQRAATNSSAASRPRGPKYGPTMLLGEQGFRLLRNKLSEIEWSGDSTHDLDKLMTLYRDWAHHLYPKFQFRDFVDKTERHCRTAPMKAYLMALRRSGEEGGRFDELEYVTEKAAVEAESAIQDVMDTVNKSEIM